MSIAVIGSNMMDLVTYIDRMPGEGETVAAPDFVMGHGGKGANQAVAARRLGSDVRMLTRVGNDAFAEHTRQNFRREGIDTDLVLETETSSGVAPIFVDPQSRNSIIIVPGANGHLSPTDVTEAENALRECSLFVLQLEIPLETVYTAIELGARHGIPVLLNPAPAAPDLELSRLRGLEWFIPNEHELAMIVGRDLENIDQMEQAAHEVREQAGITHVIVTLGAEGLLWVGPEGSRRIEGQTVDAVDTTGAGDAFIGCFAHHMDAGTDLPSALQKATVYAADSVTKRGTQTSYGLAEEIPDAL